MVTYALEGGACQKPVIAKTSLKSLEHPLKTLLKHVKHVKTLANLSKHVERLLKP